MTGYLTPEDFNPRSYKRSDNWWIGNCRSGDISIHAPTRGATSYAAIHCGLTNISIHAPTRGATTLCSQMSSSSSWFQSTLLQEERRSRSEAWGHVPKFQSTLLQEERQADLINGTTNTIFQSTLLQEERQQKCTIFLMHLCNNYCIVSI